MTSTFLGQFLQVDKTHERCRESECDGGSDPQANESKRQESVSPQLPRLQTELHRNKPLCPIHYQPPLLLVNLIKKQLDLIPLGGSKTPPRSAQTVPRDYQCLLGQPHLIRKTAVSEFLTSVT